MAANSARRPPAASGAARVDSVTTLGIGPVTYIVGNGVTVASVGTADTVQFTTYAGTLIDSDAAPALNTIEGFRPGDAIDLTGVPYTTAVDGFADTPGVPGEMQIGAAATLDFPNSGLLATDFTLSADATGGTVLSLSPTAAVAFWTGSGAGVWSQSVQWSGGVVPERTDAVAILGGAYSPIPLSLAVPSGSAQSIFLDASNGTLDVIGALSVAGTAAVSAGVLDLQPLAQMVAANVRIGAYTALTMAAGSLLILSGGSNPESEPGTPALEADWSVTLSGATLDAAAGSVLIGSNAYQALGDVTAIGASVTAELTALGSNASSYGALTIDGGAWSDAGSGSDPLAGDMIVGNGGQGDLTVMGGGVLRDAGDALFGAPAYAVTSGGTATALVTGGGAWLVGGGMTGEAAPDGYDAPLLTVSADATGIGTVAVAGTINGMSIEIAGGTVRAGALVGSTLGFVGGILAAGTLDSGTQLQLSDGAAARLGTAEGGGITLDSTSFAQIGGGAATPGELLVAAGANATLDGGVAAPTLDVEGTLAGGADLLSYSGDIAGGGTIAPQGDIALTPSGSFDTTVTLSNFSTMTLSDGSLFDGTLDAGWQLVAPGDGATEVYVDLPNLPIASAEDLWDASVGVASLGTLAPFSITAPGETIGTIGWGLSDDGNGGALIAYDAVTACYASGTAIATPHGARDVADLRPGDAVLAREAGAWVAKPVRWVGRFGVDLASHPAPDSAAPVLIRAGAVADGVPARDLRVSPDHAVWLDGALIPARLLVNGASIARDRAARRVTYHHVELDRHGLLLAEGLPAESFLDTGNRGQFAAQAGVRPLFPDLTPSGWHAGACAPHLAQGPALAAIRARLLARARKLGWRLRRHPAPALLADGRALALTRTGALAWRARVPAAARSLVLHSRYFVPHDLDPAATDRRRLGVAVATLRLGATDLLGCGAGWHAPEAGWRWTDGAAEIPVSGGGVLELVACAAAAGYWTAPAAADVIRRQKIVNG